MGIAAITIFCNESFRIPKWLKYYQEYKEELALHIIVDNNSSDDQTKQVRENFPDSVHIKLKQNGGVTAAYNAAIDEALKYPEIDAIMLICNDIRIEPVSVQSLYCAIKNDGVDMTTPVLLRKDSDIIEDGGDTISYCLFMQPQYCGRHYSEIRSENHLVKSVTGGMNLASRHFYETIGHQDENLFMYSDEIDVGLKAMKNGLKMEMVWNAKAWHQHENPPGRTRRAPASDYLMARNKVYLGRVYFGVFRSLMIFLHMIFKNCKMMAILLIKKESTEPVKFAIKGALDGLKMKMGKPSFIE